MFKLKNHLKNDITKNVRREYRPYKITNDELNVIREDSKTCDPKTFPNRGNVILMNPMFSAIPPKQAS